MAEMTQWSQTMTREDEECHVTKDNTVITEPKMNQ